jgi:hypothetical protein
MNAVAWKSNEHCFSDGTKLPESSSKQKRNIAVYLQTPRQPLLSYLPWLLIEFAVSRSNGPSSDPSLLAGDIFALPANKELV